MKENSIIPVKEKDLKQLKKLILQEFPYIDSFKERIEERIKKKKVFAFKLVKGREMLGFIEMEVKNGTGRINGIAVKKKFREKGLGSILLKFGLNFLMEKNVGRIILLVKKGNLTAKKLYERSGFRVKRKLGKKIDNSEIEEMELKKNSFLLDGRNAS